MKTLAFFFVMVVPTLGRIGESRPQCDARYGVGIISEDRTMCFYKKAGFELAFVYRAGKAVILLVTHSARDILNNPPPLSETEIETLLTANTGGSTWKKDGFGGIMNKSWITEDGLTMAMYDPFKNTLSIMTTEEFQRKVQDGKSEEKKSLEGF